MGEDAPAAAAHDTIDEVEAPAAKPLKPGDQLIWEDFAADKADGEFRRGQAEPLPGKLDYLIAPEWDKNGKAVVGQQVAHRTYKRNGDIKSEDLIASGDLTYAEAKAAAQADWNKMRA